MEGLKTSLVAVVQRVQRRAGFYLTVFGIFYYHVYWDGDLDCTCKTYLRDCRVYLLVPSLVILVVLLWWDRTLHRMWGSTCSRRPRQSWLLLPRVLEAVFIAQLWIVSVLLDGDWYVCCSETGSCSELQYPFQQPSDQLRNQGRFIGFLLLLVTTITAAVLSSLPWRRFSPMFALAFEEALLDEADDVVPLTLRRAARERLLRNLDVYVSSSDWNKCLDVDTELVVMDPPQDIPLSDIPSATQNQH